MKLFLLACIFMPVESLAAEEPTTRPDSEKAPRKGAMEVIFDERHAESSIAAQGKRSGWTLRFVEKNDPRGGRYEIADESFQVYVPDSYAPDVPHGLLVWVSPGPTGHVPADWRPVLAEKKLIAVGADNSGNDRFVWYRIGLALDAVHNLKESHTIDDRRIYVTGFSGGGRVASRLGQQYPDVFTGGAYQGGVTTFRKVPHPTDKDRNWAARFTKPRGKLLRQVKRASRHVIVVGEEDPNQLQSKTTFELLRDRERFAHVTYLEIPGQGHVVAGARSMEKAIEDLDRPLSEDDAKEEKPRK